MEKAADEHILEYIHTVQAIRSIGFKEAWGLAYHMPPTELLKMHNVFFCAARRSRNNMQKCIVTTGKAIHTWNKAAGTTKFNKCLFYILRRYWKGKRNMEKY